MQAGKLDQKIELYSKAQVNSFGSVTEAWTLVAEVWGHVISQRGNEAFEAARTNAKETIRVKLRYRADVETTWRVRWFGQDYAIFAVDRSMQRKGELWVTAMAIGVS